MEQTINPAASRYSLGAMILHWVIAIAVIANWRIAEAAEHLSKEERGDTMAWHFAIGMAILLLTIARIGWRFMKPPPPLASNLKAWERVLAKVTHEIFYLLLILLPVMGWLGMSGYNTAIDMFGLIWPILPVGFGKDTAHEILEVHGSIGGIMVLLIGLHVLGALKHQFFDRDGNLSRMLPWGTPKA